MNIAIIPARGGSKRIPRKNIKSFLGRPIISYPIEIAKNCIFFDKIVVSSDDIDILNTAKDYGADLVLHRPAELSNDTASTWQAISHSLRECERIGWDIDLICCIYPATPMLDILDLHASLVMLNESCADYCFPVAKFPSVIQRALIKNHKNEVQPINSNFENLQTQCFPDSFYDAGQFYWGRKDAWKKNEKIHSNAIAFEIPFYKAVDIDNIDDWETAEFFYKIFKGIK